MILFIRSWRKYHRRFRFFCAGGAISLPPEPLLLPFDPLLLLLLLLLLPLLPPPLDAALACCWALLLASTRSATAAGDVTLESENWRRTTSVDELPLPRAVGRRTMEVAPSRWPQPASAFPHSVSVTYSVSKSYICRST